MLYNDFLNEGCPVCNSGKLINHNYDMTLLTCDKCGTDVERYKLEESETATTDKLIFG